MAGLTPSSFPQLGEGIIGDSKHVMRTSSSYLGATPEESRLCVAAAKAASNALKF